MSTVTSTGTPALAGSPAGATALKWWMRYCDPLEGDGSTSARLRRCRSAVDALGIKPAISLAQRLGYVSVATHRDDDRPLIALNLARVLSHVRANDPRGRPMRSAGWKHFAGDRKESDAGEDRPLLSEARFRRLLDTERGEEQVVAFARLLGLLGGTVNVAALAEDFLYWDDRTKRRWSFDYYAAANAAPERMPTAAVMSNEDDDQ